MFSATRLKCIFGFYIIITLYFRNTLLAFAPITVIQKTFHQSATNPKIRTVMSPQLLLRDQKRNSFDDGDEPGFDLSESEMKKFKIWPKGVIPFYIDVLSFDKVLRDRIRNFLNNMNTVTILSFVELPSPPKDMKSRWVFFINRRGQLKCSDPHIKDFTNEGVQKVVLGYDCLSHGGALAEAVLALVGVPAQHNAPNRDDYIKVNMENIIPDKKYLFTKLKDDEWLFRDISYDFISAGHYDIYRNSANGRATMELLNQPPDILTSEPISLSAKDIWKIKMLYNYISKNKTNFSKCQRLFVSVDNTSHIKYKKEIQKPRKRPNKYLGKAEDNIDESLDINKSDKVDVSESIKESESDEDSKSTQQSNSNEYRNLSDRKQKLSRVKERLTLPNIKNPLGEFSDYNTDDEYEKIKQNRKKKVKN